MKRILTAGVWSLAVAVFFTGCSSLAGSAQVDVQEIESSAEAEAVTDENGEDRLGITKERQKMPDYFQQNMTDKFKDLEGKRAFRIKEGHSQLSRDMEGFQIGGLGSDKTFIYGYVTQAGDGEEEEVVEEEEEEEGPKTMVHCGAFYNYETEDFQVFHENIFEREEEGEESFFLQVSEATGEVFVYDNGHGYLYSSSGELKFHADIESFVRKQFTDVYGVSVINAVTDWQRRIYLELSIEKEKIDIPELEGDVLEEALKNRDSDGSGEDSEESDESDEELEGKVESRIMVYQYQDINSGMDQNNEAFGAQREAWIAMAEGMEFEAAPSIMGDWNTVTGNIPDVWGDAFLGGFDNTPVYQWKESAAFGSEDSIPTFFPTVHSYVRFRDVKAGWNLENLFIPIKDKYSELFGKTGRFIYYNPQDIQRNYTLVTYEDVEKEGEDGQTVTETVRHTQGRVQTIRGINISRYANLENAYVESYSLLDSEKAVSLGRCIGSEILCWGKDGKVRWIRPGGDFTDTPYQVMDDTEDGDYMEAGAYLEDGVVYHVEYGKKGMAIVRDAAHGGSKDEAPLKILYANLAGGFQPGETAYDKMFEEGMEEELEEGESVYGNGFFTEDQVLHGQLDVDLALASQLAEKGAGGICKMAMGAGRAGFLMTSQDKGLVFYSPYTGESAVLEGGTWFRTWKSGSGYISVGFPNGSSSYSVNDVAFSRVYEYNLNQLCNESMKKSLEDILAAEEAERESEASEEASKQSGEETEETEENETIKSPLDRWNEEFQQKYDRENRETSENSW